MPEVNRGGANTTADSKKGEGRKALNYYRNKSKTIARAGKKEEKKVFVKSRTARKDDGRTI